MYQQFFGFNTLPFKITPDERVFFAGAHRQEMLDALLYGIERGEGIITVIGEVGIGKTTLARVLSNRFSAYFSIISIFTPNVSALDMLRLIAEEAGLNPPATAGKVELMQLIRAYCLQLHQQGRRFLILVDEAQTMLVDTIEELRLLSNMQVDDVKLVQVLLFGQTELDRMLNSPELRQVKDRVVFQIHIEPFSRDELAEYLAFRLQQAGYKGQYFFSSAVVDAIYRKSQGYARAVNRLADQALMSAFAEQTHQVEVRHVESSNQEAIQPLATEAPSPSTQYSQVSKPGRWLLVAALVLLLASVVGMMFLTPGVFQQSAEGELAAVAGSTPPASPTETIVTPPLDASPKPATEGNTTVSEAAELASAPASSDAPMQQPKDVASVSTELVASEFWLKAGSNDAQWQAIHQQQLQLFNELANSEKYTIQLMSSPWRLREFFVQEAADLVNRLPKAPAFYYDYSATSDRPRIAAIYGVYDTKEAAKQALKDLAAMNKGYRPDMMSFKQVVALMQSSQVLISSP